MNLKPSLFVLVPIPITDAMLISTTVPENDYPEWAGGVTYVTGDRRISTATHRIYESLRDGNTDKDPTDIANLTGELPWWQDIGPTNQRAMFDGEVSTQTAVASPLTVVIRPGFFNALYLGGLDAEHLDVVVKDAPGGNVVFSHSGSLEGSAPGDYYEYYYAPFKPLRDFLLSEIDQYKNAEVTVTLTKASGPVKCGILALGDLRPLGRTLYGAKCKPRTFSYIDIDKFGKSQIKRRKRTRDLVLTAWVKLSEANAVEEAISELLDVPCVVIGIGLPEYAGLRAFGLISGELSYDHPRDVLLTVDVQGFI